ncbi:MAG: hypothetical protein HQ523_09150 [Lentisphaerae bacterium]|nr:hypothetical protein [Lentisphaerota bacterium]
MNPGLSNVNVKVSLVIGSNGETVKVVEAALEVPASGRTPFRLAIPETLPETGQARLTVSQGDTILYDHTMPFVRDTPEPVYLADDNTAEFEFVMKHLPSLNRVVARADFFGYPKRRQIASVALRLRDTEDTIMREQPLSLGADASVDGAMNLGQLAEGDYIMELVVLDDEGNVLASARRDMKRLQFAWLGAGIGNSDEVPPPWTPLAVKGACVTCWGRTTTFGSNALPVEIEVKGQSILARPISLIATIDGREEVLSGDQLLAIESDAANRVVLVGGDTRIAVKSVMAYDGFIQVDLTLAPGKLDALRLDIPLRADQATLIHAVGDHMRDGQYSGVLPAGAGQVWSSVTHLVNRSIFGTFVPYVWLGDEERGICWTADSDRGWELDDNAAALTINRQEGVVTASLHFIGRPTQWAVPRTLRFAIQATPLKPMPRGWRAWSFDPDGWPRTPGSKRIQYYPGRSYFWDSVDIFGLEAADMDAFRRRYADFVKRSDADTAVLTTTLNILGAGTPAPQVFRDEWFINGLELSSHSWDSRRFGEDKQRYMYGQAALIPSVIDYRLWAARELIRHGGLNGIFEDNSYAWPVVDPDMGYGYQRDDGEWQADFLISGNRDYHRRLSNVFRQEGVEPFIFTHMTTANILPALSHATVAFDGEWKEISDDSPDFMTQWPLDYFRAVDLWQHTGLVPLWLPMAHLVKDPDLQIHHTRCMLAVLQLHDILCDNGHARWQVIRDLEIARMAFGIGDDDVLFHGYWDNGHRLQLSADQVKCSFWQKPGRALFVLANFAREPAEVICTFDQPVVSAIEAMAHTAVPVNGTHFTVTVPPRDFQLIQVETTQP